MADFFTSAYAQTVGNTGATVAKLGDNALKNVISHSDAGREFILTITAQAGTLTDVKLNEAVRYLTRTNFTSANTDGTSAGTIAAIGLNDGTAFNPAADTVVHVRYQTTEDFAITDFNANITATQVAIVCQFKPADYV